MIIQSLFHWSSRKNRDSILKNGLQIMHPMRTDSDLRQPDGSLVCFPWICTATSPARAWNYVLDKSEDEEPWDLYEIWLSKNDEIHIRSFQGDTIVEVRIHNTIPPDRITWIGQRNEFLHS